MFGTQLVPAETSDLEQARQRAHIRIGQPWNLQGRPHEFQDGLPGRAADVGGGEDSLEAVVASDDGEAGIGQVPQVVEALLDRQLQGRSVEGRRHSPAPLGQQSEVEPRHDAERDEGERQQEPLHEPAYQFGRDGRRLFGVGDRDRRGLAGQPRQPPRDIVDIDAQMLPQTDHEQDHRKQQDLRHRRPFPGLLQLASRPHGRTKQQGDEQRRQAHQDDEWNPEPGRKFENEPARQAFDGGHRWHHPCNGK